MIDTLKVSKELMAAGFTPEQSESLARITTEAVGGEAASKADLARVEASLRADLTLLKWMVGTNVAFCIGILLKLLR